jgi:hypothetical protein
MVSERRMLANRLNARRSTGPKTKGGKSRSRRNALKHGLTARTVVDIFEDDGEFEAFARQIGAAYRPASPVHRELIFRLATLLWRLRRVHAVETGLLKIQAEQQRELPRPSSPPGLQQNIIPLPAAGGPSSHHLTERERIEAKAKAFLRLCNLNGDAFDQIARYETTLWRQTMQLLFLLEHIAVIGPRPRFPD